MARFEYIYFLCLLKHMDRRKDRDTEKVSSEKEKVGLSLSRKTIAMIKAIALVEDRKMSDVVEEAVESVFSAKLESYSEATRVFIEEKFPELVEGDSVEGSERWQTH